MPSSTFHNLPDAKRARIIEMAIEEFSDNPFSQASLSRICTRAGIAKGSIYQYFDNKLDLYRYLVTEEAWQRKLDEIKAAAADAGPEMFDQIERMLVASVHFAVDNPRISRMTAQVLEPSADPDLQALHDELRTHSHGFTREMLQAAQAAGHVRGDIDVDTAAYFVSAVVDVGLASALLARMGISMHQLFQTPQAAHDLPEADLHALIHTTVDLLRRGLSG